MAVEAPDSRGARLWSGLAFPVARLYLFLREIHLLGGDFAWGDRYVSTAVELVTLLAVPLLLRYREHLGKAIWRAGWVLIFVSLAIQLASLAFWLPLEIYQMETSGIRRS